MFASCEYIIALANMAFHVTVILDFPTEYLVVAKGANKSNATAKLDWEEMILELLDNSHLFNISLFILVYAQIFC